MTLIRAAKKSAGIWALIAWAAIAATTRAAPPYPMSEAPPTTQAAAATQPASTQSASTQSASTQSASTEPAGRAMPDGRITFNFKDASLDAVLSFLSEATGLVVLNNAKIDGRVNVISRQPLTMDEAVGVLGAVLKDKGYAVVRTGRTIKIVPLDSAKTANIPVHTGNNPHDVDQNDEMITQVIPVRFADAAQLKKDLAPLIPSYADLSANVSTNSLILTDTGAGVHRIMEVIKALDTAVSAVTQIKVFTLKYANATNAAKLITSVFQPESTATQQPQPGGPRIGRFFGFGGGGAPGQPTQDTEGARPQTKVVASADDRTNTLVISAPNDTMPVIEMVLKELDSNPSQNEAVFIYHLLNGQADNIQSIVNSIFSSGASTASHPTTSTTAGQRTSPLTGGPLSSNSFSTRSNSGIGAASMGFPQNTAGASATAAGTGYNAARPAAAPPQLSTAAQANVTALAGQVYAVADLDTNSVLITTATENFERVKAVLAELDRPVPQVLIKVLVAEVTHTNDLDLGVEFSAINIGAGSSGNTVFSDFGLASAVTAAAAAGAPNGLVAKIVQSNFDATIRLLEQVGKVDVLSRPYILGSDNQTASILVGQQVPLITSTLITDTGQVNNQFTYQAVGIILNVTPHINPNGQVVMDINPEISALTDSTVTIQPGVTAPIISQRSAQTRVAIRDGQTVVIGGLMQDQKNQTISKVPLLGDLPWVGALFQRNQTTKVKTELLIFLTPHVAMQPGALEKMTKDEKAGMVIVPKAVAPGIYQEHMEGLNRGGAQTQPAPTSADPATQPDTVIQPAK